MQSLWIHNLLRKLKWSWAQIPPVDSLIICYINLLLSFFSIFWVIFKSQFKLALWARAQRGVFISRKHGKSSVWVSGVHRTDQKTKNQKPHRRLATVWISGQILSSGKFSVFNRGRTQYGRTVEANGHTPGFGVPEPKRTFDFNISIFQYFKSASFEDMCDDCTNGRWFCKNEKCVPCCVLGISS